MSAYNYGCLELGPDRFLVTSRHQFKLSGRVRVAITDGMFNPRVEQMKVIDLKQTYVHDARPFRYPDGRLGLIAAYQSSTQSNGDEVTLRTWGADRGAARRAHTRARSHSAVAAPR